MQVAPFKHGELEQNVLEIMEFGAILQYTPE